MTDMGFGFAFVLNDMVSSPATQIGNSFNGLVQKTTGATQKLGGAMDSMASSMNLGVFQKWGQLDLANQITNFGQGVTSFFERSIDKAGEFSDKYTDIQKTAGLTNTEVRQLADELSGLDTRTSLGSLLDIAKVGGAVGVTGKEMQGFVESTNMAAVALGDEFKGGVEGVVKPLGTMKNLFAETKNLDFGTAVNNIGSAINQLGGEGLATGGNIADFTARIGQLGALAPSITQTMGLGAALEELGINAEIAAGGVTNIMLMAGQNIGAYSKQLKMSEEQFKSLMNTDPNEMFLKLAESMQGMSSTQVIDTMKNLKIGSQESIKVMSLLANKTDLVTKRQQSAAEAFAKGTSLQDEYNLKNESLGASMAKLANKFEVFMLKVGENIAPVFQPFFDGFTKLINLATAFINTPLGTNIAKVVAILGAGALVFGT
ncbi:MAG: phage tail tape measure protein, partial [Bacteroidetes bacterium]